MKKFLLLTLTLLLCLTGCGKTGSLSLAGGGVKITIRSDSAFVYDLNTGNLACHSPDGSETVYPASLTKLLTCLTALEIMDPSTVITPGYEVYLPGKGSSSAFIRPHHALTLEMLVEAMMLPSGNDAAYAVSAACGRKMADDDSLSYRDAVKVFVNGMNDFAARLGCTGSNFTVPDGFAGEENISTLSDMALIAKAASENRTIMKYAGMQSDSVTYASGHTNTWPNTNLQLDPDSDYYDPNVIGLKTGSLEDYRCLITLWDNGEQRFLIGVFGADSDKERYGDVREIIAAFPKSLTPPSAR